MIVCDFFEFSSEEYLHFQNESCYSANLLSFHNIDKK